MPSPSSSTTKTLIHTFFLSHIRRVSRALTAAKSFLVDFFRRRRSAISSPVHVFMIYFTSNKNNKKSTDKINFGSFRLHYNWCSSRYWSDVPTSQSQGATWRYEDVVVGDQYCRPEASGLSGYLRWLEENKKDDGVYRDDTVTTYNNNEKNIEGILNEIDELADVFIARCHEKLMLEKQESDRRFHEMLARSM